MRKDISEKLDSLLQSAGLDKYLVRRWTYRGVCHVLDYVYQGVKFGFDITPLDNGRVILELVERRHETGIELISAANKRRLLCGDASIDEAVDKIHDAIARLVKLIDDWRVDKTDRSSSPGHSVAPHPAKSLRVGVLTLPLNNNIGGNLQAYAMMEALKKLGHSPVFINRRRPLRDVAPVDSVDPSRSLWTNSVGLGARSPNSAFVDKHLAPMTVPFRSTQSLARNVDRLGLDAIIAGSDQIWRPRYSQSILADYFFDFLPADSSIRRISYAASFGAPVWEFKGEQTQTACRLIKNFDAVSVREDSAVDLCARHLGVKAEHVLDPTLLLDRSDYAPAIAEAKHRSHNGQIVTYILDSAPDKEAVVQKLSAALGLNAFTTTGSPFLQQNNPVNAPNDKSVQQWLSSLEGAGFVVTDSFHGVVFSILFNKPFIAYGNPQRGMARFTSLLKIFGLEQRLVVDSSEVDLQGMLKPIDWEAVNKRLAMWRKKSFDFLVSALTEKKQGAAALIQPVLVTRAKVEEVRNHPLNVLCTGCGVCVSESDGLLAMAWNGDGFLAPEAKSPHIPARAIKVCPFNPQPDEAVRDEDALAKIFLPAASNFDARIGRFEKTYAGYSKKFRSTSSSGGIATHVFKKLLDQGYVDYLFVVQSSGATEYKYQVFRKDDDILAISKTRYFPVSLDQFFSTIARLEGRVAVSGIPCFLKAIRLKQHYDPELKKKIPFLLGIICGGLKSRWYTDFLAQSAGIQGDYIQPEYRVKDPESSAIDYSFSAKSAEDAHGKLNSVKMLRLGDMWGTGLFKARACDFCTDVVAELADISLGDAWLPEYKQDGLGNNVVITRSALAERIIREGFESGELVLDDVTAARIVQSQSGGFRHRQNNIKFRAWSARRFLDFPLPVIRARLLRGGSMVDALIQILRERTRSKSLLYWKEARNARTLGKRLRGSLRILKNMTNAGRDSSGKLNALLAQLARQNFDLAGVVGEMTKEQRLALRWLLRGSNMAMLRMALRDDAVVPPPTEADIKTEHTKAKSEAVLQMPKKKISITKSVLAGFPDVPLWRVSALEVYERANGLFISPNNNKITITGISDVVALKNTYIYFSGKGNEVLLDGLKNVSKLEIACVDGSTVQIRSPLVVRGAVIMATHKTAICVGKDCQISRDVLMYCSGSHTLYDMDGKRRGERQLEVGNHVWIGQGVKLLAGASVGDGSVIGAYSVLAGKVPNNCSAAGNPCRVLTQNISWTARTSDD